MNAPMNTFASLTAFPRADMKAVVRPNFDTLYSSAWLDLTGEPMIVSAPDTQGALPAADARHVDRRVRLPGLAHHRNPGRRLCLVPPGWSGALPAATVRIDAPTPYVWIIGRTKTDGPDDYDAVHRVQAGLQITPLAFWQDGRPGGRCRRCGHRHEDAAEGPSGHHGRRRVLRLMPPKFSSCSLPDITDQPILAQMRRSASRGQRASTSIASIRRSRLGSRRHRGSLEADGLEVSTIARVVDGWSMNTDTMGSSTATTT